MPNKRTQAGRRFDDLPTTSVPDSYFNAWTIQPKQRLEQNIADSHY